MWNVLVNSLHTLLDMWLLIHAEKISNILKSLKNGAAGYDELNACLLKHISSFITEPLKYLRNLSLSEGVFPTELKLADVIPLYKSDDVFLFNNYRPVSSQCVISKVFEKVMYNRLIDFLETFAILNNLDLEKYIQHTWL